MIPSLIMLLACKGEAPKVQVNDSASSQVEAPGIEPQSTPEAASLRRLTVAQYRNSIEQIFGNGILQPTALEPDLPSEGLLSVGSAVTSISPVGVERYEDAAYLISEQVMSESQRETFIPCSPADSTDEVCAREWIEIIGRQVYRRGLTEDELDALVNVHSTVGSESGDFYIGAEFALAAMLQSPHFLYRTEHGDGGTNITDTELASKLSFLLWNSPPDLQLLEAAESGRLSDEDGLREEVDRLIADDRFRWGVRNIFNEIFTLYSLDNLIKDPLIYTHANSDLGPAAREETLLGLEKIIVEDDRDFRDIFTTQNTFVDRRLAALYNIPAPSELGFEPITLDTDDGRRGLLGQASILAQFAHTSSSSATLRGVFIRKTLLCHEIPPPPADVDTSIPEADANAPTLRDRIASHLEEPTCATCHQLTDLVGLGLENFDGIGRWRTTENEAVIDASGTLDGTPFSDGWELGETIKMHPSLGSCFAGHVYRYSMGHPINDESDDFHQWLTQGFAYEGWSFAKLLRTTALSQGFRTAGAIE